MLSTLSNLGSKFVNINIGVAIVFSGIICLAGCKPDEDKAIELAQKEISELTKDPDSVQFRNEHFLRKDSKSSNSTVGTVCGEVNGKNNWGAYVGYHSFFVTLEMTPKGSFSTGVNYKIIKIGIAPSAGHELQRFKQLYRSICDIETIP